MTYPLIIITICAKYFQYPFNYVEVIDQAQNIPYNNVNLWPLSVTLVVGTHVLRLIWLFVQSIFKIPGYGLDTKYTL
jgi:hypothetical protein